MDCTSYPFDPSMFWNNIEEKGDQDLPPVPELLPRSTNTSSQRPTVLGNDNTTEGREGDPGETEKD
jgi:hypothetical protein